MFKAAPEPLPEPPPLPEKLVAAEGDVAGGGRAFVPAAGLVLAGAGDLGHEAAHRGERDFGGVAVAAQVAEHDLPQAVCGELTDEFGSLRVG